MGSDNKLKIGEFITFEDIDNYNESKFFHVGEGIYTKLSYDELLYNERIDKTLSILKIYEKRESIKIVPARNYASYLIGEYPEIPNVLEFMTTGDSEELIFFNHVRVKLTNHPTLINHKSRLSSLLIFNLLFEKEWGEISDERLCSMGKELSDLDYQNLLDDVMNEDPSIIELVNKMKK